MGLRRTAFAAAMISLAMLAGCTAESHPTALGTAASSTVLAPTVNSSTLPSSVAVSPKSSAAPSTQGASTAGTPTSAADSSPTALSSNDIATGVRATAQAFFDDLNIAFASGDVRKITALTSPTCGCRTVVKTIQQTYAQHQHIVGVVATVTSIDVVSFIATAATADIHYAISGGRILDANGGQVNTSVPDADQHSAIFIMNAMDTWIIEQNTSLNRASK